MYTTDQLGWHLQESGVSADKAAAVWTAVLLLPTVPAVHQGHHGIH